MDEGPFLRAICEHPDDDGPRLVYADWLDERGDPKGEFIRVQCALEHLQEGDHRRAGLKAREAELLATHRAEWEAPLRALFPPLLEPRYIEYRGGLPWYLHNIRIEHFLKAGDKLFEVAPITGVDFSRSSFEDIANLADSPHLGNLNYLSLSGNGIGDAGVRRLAASQYLRKLIHLDLSDNHISAAGIQALTRSPSLDNLTHLELRKNFIGPAGAEALAGWSQLDNLTCLNLDFCLIADEGAQALAASRHLGNLRDLSLRYNEISPEGAWALVESPQLRSLAALHLPSNQIGPTELAEIQRSTAQRQTGRGL